MSRRETVAPACCYRPRLREFCRRSEEPPLWLIWYDKLPTHATSRARVERFDPGAAPEADPVWAELAADGAPAAGRPSAVVGAVRRALARAIRESVDPLAGVSGEALLPAPIHVEPGDRPAAVNRAAATAREIADPLRRAFTEELAVRETLAPTRPRALCGRTVLEVCTTGESTAAREWLVAADVCGGDA